MHRIDRAAVVWFRRLPPWLFLKWSCGASTGYPTFDVEGRPLCLACDWANVVDQGQRVYYGRLGNLIKIGCSSRPAIRLRALAPELSRPTLLATEPGGFAVEWERHQQFAHLRQHGEWFRAGDDLLAHIEGLS